MPLHLDGVLNSAFFRRFGFEAFDEPAPAEGSRAWHCFRPTGALASAEMEVDLLVDQASEIIDASLALDRRHVDNPDGRSESDLTESFLSFFLSDPPSFARDLIANIADVSRLRRSAGRGTPNAPLPDPTGALRVFEGTERWTSFQAHRLIVSFENRGGRLPRRCFHVNERTEDDERETPGHRWLRIGVHFLDGAGAQDKTGLYFRIMRPPTQCALWTRPDLVHTVKFSAFFDVEKDIVDSSHLERSLIVCRECKQKYFFEWYEDVDWSGSNDKMYTTFIPVETAEQVAELEAASVFDLMTYYPRIHAEGRASWKLLYPDHVRRDEDAPATSTPVSTPDSVAPAPQQAESLPLGGIKKQDAPILAQTDDDRPIVLALAGFPKVQLSKMGAAIVVMSVPTTVLLFLGLFLDAWMKWRHHDYYALGVGWFFAYAAAVTSGYALLDGIIFAPAGKLKPVDAMKHALTFGVVIVELVLIVFAGSWDARWNVTRVIATAIAWGLATSLLRRAMD